MRIWAAAFALLMCVPAVQAHHSRSAFNLDQEVTLKRLLVSAGVLLTLISVFYGLTNFGLAISKQAAE